jgi:hypothetical protein
MIFSRILSVRKQTIHKLPLMQLRQISNQEPLRFTKAARKNLLELVGDTFKHPYDLSYQNIPLAA